MSAAKRDDNREVAIILQNLLGTSTLYPTGLSLTNATPMHVALVDGNGDQITSFGGGTQYTDAVAAAAHPVGTGIIFNNGGTYNFVSAAQPLPVTGSLSVGGTTDNSAFTAGTTTGTPAMGFYHSTIDAVTDGRAAALAIDAKRNLFVVLRDAAGNARGLNIDASGQLAVTIAASQTIGLAAGSQVIGHVITDTGSTTAVTGTVTVDTELPAAATIAADGAAPTVPGVASYGFIKTTGANTWDRINQIANATNSVGTGIQAVGLVGQFDDVAPTAITENQFGNLRMSTNRALYVMIRDNAGNERGLNIDASGQLAVTIAASQTIAVTNAGTFAVQATPVTQADTFMLGGVNIKEINAVTPLMGAGNGGTGSLRVNIASDQVSIPVGATLTAETTKVIGTVRMTGNIGATVDSTVGAGTAPTNQITVGSIYSTTAPAPTNGQAMAQQADQAGNLRVFPGIALAALAAWNSVTALNATQTIFNNSGAPAVLVQLTQTTTLTAGAITFEASFDGTTFVTVPANQVIDPTSATFAQIAIPYTVQASTNKYFLLNSNGWQALRIKLSTQITGTGTVTPNYALLPFFPVTPVMAYNPTASNFLANVTLQTQTDTVMVGGVNIKEINAVTPLMGAGNGGTGSLRVNIASDQVSIPVAATLAAETTKIIGTVNIAASQTVGLVAGTALVGKVGIDQTTPGTTNAVALTQIGSTTIVNGGTAGSQSVGGIVANNGTINSAVNPILVGGQAVSSENAANTTAKLSQFVTDLVGKLIVLPYANPENFVSGAITSAMTGTTTTSLLAAPAAGLRNYITQITVSNSHATVGTDVIIQDGSGGTTLYTIPAAAVYGGAAITFPTPLRQPTTATAIFCANVTTGANTKVSASGYKGV